MHLAFLVIDLITLFTVILYSEILFTENNNLPKTRIILIRFMYLFFNYIILAVISVPICKIIFQILSLNLLMSSFKGSIVSKCSYSCLFLCFMSMSEVMSCYIVAILFSLDISSMTQDYLILSVILACIFQFITVMIAHVSKVQKGHYNIGSTLLLLVIPICSIFVILTIHDFLTHPESISYELAIFSIGILALVNIYFYFLIGKIQDFALAVQENKILKTQMNYYEERQNNLEKSYQKIRAMKHDLNNHYIYLLEQSKTLSTEELSKEIALLIKESKPLEVIPYCNNKTLNSILNYKLYEATSKGIPLDIKISVRQDTILDEKLLCITLGNLLDNAIENFDNSPKIESCLSLRIYEEGQALYVKISNPYTKPIRYKNNIPITNKKDSENHGIGIQSVRRLLEEKEGTLLITVKEHEFLAEVILYNGAQHLP